MKNSNASKFLDGCIVSSGKYFFSSRMDALPLDEYGHSLLTLFDQGVFQFATRDQTVESVCASDQAGEMLLCALPRFNPHLGFYDEKLTHIKDEIYTDDGENMATMVKIIDGCFYVSCMNAKIYQKRSEGWHNFNAGLSAEDFSSLLGSGSLSLEILMKVFDQVVNINAINGTSKVLYAATFSGEVFKHDGEQWGKLKSPVDGPLATISFINEADAYIAGHHSMLLLASPSGIISMKLNVDDYFTSSAVFRNKLYLGGYKGLYVLEGENVKRIIEASRSDFKCVALDSKNDELLVVGERWFCVYNGATWIRTGMPGNDAFNVE